jgi:hypothetical protein
MACFQAFYSPSSESGLQHQFLRLVTAAQSNIQNKLALNYAKPAKSLSKHLYK